MIPSKLKGAARVVGYVSDVPRHRRGTTIEPRLLTHTVTFRRDARCTTSESSDVEGQHELSLEEIGRFYRQLPRLDAIRLAGGEPFVRGDLADIAHLAAETLRPRMVHVTTDGFLGERIVDLVDRWDRPESLHVQVSLDGLASRHDDVRGVPGSFERAMSTLRALSSYRAQGRIRLAVNQTVIDGEGAREYAALRDEMHKLDIPVYVVLAYRDSAIHGTEGDRCVAAQQTGAFEPHGSFTALEISTLLDELEDDLELLPPLESRAQAYYIAGLRRRLLGESGPSAPSCAALHAHLQLLPNGDIPTCQNNTKIVGNVRGMAFPDAWASAVARDQRGWVKGCAGCWTKREVLPSAFYTGDLPVHALKRTFHPKVPRERALHSPGVHSHRAG